MIIIFEAVRRAWNLLQALALLVQPFYLQKTMLSFIISYCSIWDSIESVTGEPHLVHCGSVNSSRCHQGYIPSLILLIHVN